MYHPDAFMKIAHTREAELIREAEACRAPQGADAKAAWLSGRALAVALTLVALGAVLVLLIG